MSISFPLSIEVQLARASVMTNSWAKGKDKVWKDDKEWRIKIPNRHKDIYLFKCKVCQKSFLKEVVCKNFMWIPKVCPECRQKKYNQVLADLREKRENQAKREGLSYPQDSSLTLLEK